MTHFEARPISKCLSTKQIPWNVSVLSKHHSIKYSEKKFIQARRERELQPTFHRLMKCKLFVMVSKALWGCVTDWVNSLGICKVSKFPCKYTISHVCHLTFLYHGSLTLKNKTYHISYLHGFTDYSVSNGSPFLNY